MFRKGASLFLSSSLVLLLALLAFQFSDNFASASQRPSIGSGNSDELVIGVNGIPTQSLVYLESLIDKYDGRIINRVSFKESTEAIVVSLPQALASSLAREAQTMLAPRYIEPNTLFKIDLTPNDPYWGNQWGPEKIEANYAWNVTVGNTSVLTAVIDTGVDWHHPDLAANYAPLGYDWVNNDTDPMDDNGHGTHVAGIIAAVINNGIGVAGISQVKIMAEKGLNQTGYGTEADLANAIVHAVDKGAKIINMSWGDYTASSLIQDAIMYAHNAGVLLIAAAGNDATSQRLYPAAYSQVIGVSATDQLDERAYFSNYGYWIELSAPGVGVFSTLPNDGYGSRSGTSMAAPFVSGVAGLIWSKFPTATQDKVRTQLRNTADDLGTQGFDPSYGYGRINAKRAVETSIVAHDIAITTIMPRKTVVGQGLDIEVDVDLTNNGEATETFNVALYANSTAIQSRVVTLLNGNTQVTTFTWNTTGIAKSRYSISAYATPVSGETNTTNNRFTDGTVTVSIVGDINGPTRDVPDRKVDIRDLAALAKAYVSDSGSPKWDPNSDIDDDGKVDIKDLALMTNNFGKTDP